MQQGPGPRPFDASLRHLLEGYPESWLVWLGLPVDGPVHPVDSDLSTVLAEVDKVLRVDGASPWLAHFEPQASRDSELPLRLLQYHALLSRRHMLPIETTVVLLRPAADGPELSGRLEQVGPTGELTFAFRYRVVRLWERPVEELLGGGLGVLPLAPLAAMEPVDLPRVIQRLGARLSSQADLAVANDVWGATLLLLGLRYDDAEIKDLVRRMSWVRESSTYRVIHEEGRVSEARRVVLEFGTEKFGPPDAAAIGRLESLDDLDALQRLIRRAWTASSWQELLEVTSER